MPLNWFFNWLTSFHNTSFYKLIYFLIFSGISFWFNIWLSLFGRYSIFMTWGPGFLLFTGVSLYIFLYFTLHSLHFFLFFLSILKPFLWASWLPVFWNVCIIGWISPYHLGFFLEFWSVLSFGPYFFVSVHLLTLYGAEP